MIYVYLFILFFIFHIYCIKNRNRENFTLDKCPSAHIPPSAIYGKNIGECIDKCNAHIDKIVPDSKCKFVDGNLTANLKNLENRIYNNFDSHIDQTDYITNKKANVAYKHMFTNEESIYPTVKKGSTTDNISTRCLSECLSCKSPTRCRWKHVFKNTNGSRMSGGLLPSENQFLDTSFDQDKDKEIKLEYSSGNNMLYWTINKGLIDDYNGGCVNNNMYNISFKINVVIKKLFASVTAASTAASTVVGSGTQKERIYRLCDLIRTEDENVNNYKFQATPDFFEDSDACYNITVEYNNDNYMNIKSKSLEICKKEEDSKLPGIMSSTDILGNLLNKTLEISF